MCWISSEIPFDSLRIQLCILNIVAYSIVVSECTVLINGYYLTKIFSIRSKRRLRFTNTSHWNFHIKFLHYVLFTFSEAKQKLGLFQLSSLLKTGASKHSFESFVEFNFFVIFFPLQNDTSHYLLFLMLIKEGRR